ncbi:hypothetical protein PG984_009245 [Apiospora sp. TS-2023a]
MASQQLVRYDGAGSGRVNAIEIVCNSPPEIFILVLDRLSLPDQASLSQVNRALRDRVIPVFNGWAWRNPPVTLPSMLIWRQVSWTYLEMAEQAASAKGFVACPWCATIHPPLAAIDRQGFQGVPLSNSAPSGFRAWHPLVIYAFVSYSQSGRPTTDLRQFAQLDRHLQSHMEPRGEDSVHCKTEEWRMAWQPGTGLFIRHRMSEIVFSEDAGGALSRPCCPCERNYLTYNYDGLREEDFGLAFPDCPVYTTFETGNPAPNELQDVVALSETHRRSSTLLVGPVDGCANCGIDWQAAWTSSDGEGEIGTIHWTTWFYLGTPTSAMDAIQALLDRNDRANPARPALLGIGNVAQMSRLTNDYHN